MLKASLRFPLRTRLLATWLLATGALTTGALTTGLLTGLLALFPVSASFARSPDGAEGQVDIVVRVAALMPCGLPSAFEREITTVLEGTSQVSRELWTLELVSTAKP